VAEQFMSAEQRESGLKNMIQVGLETAL
jgi:hypothetical protein